jgi:hypothetical protein
MDMTNYTKENINDCRGIIRSNLGRSWAKKTASFREFINDNLKYAIAPIAALNFDMIYPAEQEKAGKLKALCNEHVVGVDVVMIDIDNQYPIYDKVEGTITSTGNKCKAIGDLYMDLDKLEMLWAQYNIMPAAVVASKSATKEHFKAHIIFLLDRHIDNMNQRDQIVNTIYNLHQINGYAIADGAAKTRSNVFYPGSKELLYNECNIVNVDSLLKLNTSKPDKLIYIQDGDSITPASKSAINTTRVKSTSARTKTAARAKAYGNSNLEMIIKRDVTGLRDALSKSHAIEYTLATTTADVYLSKEETINFIINKKLIKNYCSLNAQTPETLDISIVFEDKFDFTSHINMAWFLGLPLGKSFNCILGTHEDKNPSASINRLHDGRYVYNCASEDCLGLGKHLSIISVIQTLSGCTIAETMRFIKQVLNVELEYQWQKEAREEIDLYIEYLESDVFRQDHKVLYENLIRSNNMGLLKFYLRAAKKYIYSDGFCSEGMISFYMGLRYVSTHLKDEGLQTFSYNTISKKLNYLCRLGLLSKLDRSSIQDKVLQRAIKDKQEKQIRYHLDFLIVPQYTDQLLYEAEAVIANDKERYVRKTYQSRAQDINAYGIEAADTIYVQDANRELSALIAKFYTKYHSHAITLLQRDGYTTEKLLLNQMRGYTSYEKQNLSGQCMPRLLKDLNLVAARLNKMYREKHNIPGELKSNSTIIIPATE